MVTERLGRPYDGEPLRLDDQQFLLAQFPIKRRRAYLNNASIGVIPELAVASVTGFLRQVQESGRNHYPDWCAHADSAVKERIARLIGARRSEIAFTKNTTEGINIVANGLRWQAGDNVIVPDIEYPSNVYPWLQLAARGVEVRWVTNRSGRIEAADIEKLIDRRTRLITLSAVQFSNGYRQNLPELCELCRRRAVLLHLDAIQWVGALSLDVHELGIDFLSVGGHKWLLAPIGTGFFYCSEAALDLIHPPSVGYHSVDKHEDHMDYDLTFRVDAGRFEEALVNFPGIWGLDAAIDLQLRIGPHEIEEAITSLCELAEERLLARGVHIATPRDTSRSGILCFTHPHLSTEEGVPRLRDAGVDVASRGGAIRISPSFYNDSEEIERLIEALPRVNTRTRGTKNRHFADVQVAVDVRSGSIAGDPPRVLGAPASRAVESGCKKQDGELQ